MVLDVSNDWLLFDWLQTISYESRLSDSTFNPPVSCQALKREDKKDHIEAEALDEEPRHVALWEMWATAMASPVVPKRGDRFSAVGVTGSQIWIVESVDYCDRTTRYRVKAFQFGAGS